MTAEPKYDQSMTLLERGPLLVQLRDLLVESRHGRGHLILISGEAGIGKTALVEAFCTDSAGDVAVLWGSCDAVVPARPFAPLVDIANKVNGPLREALDAVDRNRVFDAFLALLRQPRDSPRAVVFDDLQWADEATLDLLSSGGGFATCPFSSSARIATRRWVTSIHCDSLSVTFRPPSAPKSKCRRYPSMPSESL